MIEALIEVYSDGAATVDFEPANGWTYARLLDPANGQYQVSRVTRSDGRELIIGANAWQTNRILVGDKAVPTERYRLHLFDRDGSGEYWPSSELG